MSQTFIKFSKMSVKHTKLTENPEKSHKNSESFLIKRANRAKFSRVPFYLKKDLPDQRFLAMRLDIHKRNLDNIVPDSSFFDPMIDHEFKHSSHKKKRKTRFLNIFNRKQKEYREQFTSGHVEFKKENLYMENSNLSPQLDQRFQVLRGISNAKRGKSQNFDKNIRDVNNTQFSAKRPRSTNRNMSFIDPKINLDKHTRQRNKSVIY